VSLAAAVRRLHATLAPHGVLVGGVCGAMLGVERFTRDVDIATDLAPEAVMSALAQASIGATLRRGGPGEPLSWVVSGLIDGVPFQVLAASDLGVSVERAELRAELRIASVPDFIVSKCRAGGQQDLHDVAVLCLLDPSRLDFAQSQAAATGCRNKLDLWLADERLRARYDVPRHD
jgi:hypothetical protein